MVDILPEMITAVLDKISIRKITQRYNLNTRTVWEWRMKILKVISKTIDKNSPFSQLVFSDETFLEINLKGTKPEKMPRNSYKCGDRSSKNSKKVCIQTALDDNKKLDMMINGINRANLLKLEKFFKDRIVDDSVLVTDGEMSYKRFKSNLIYKKVIIKSNEKSHKNGKYSLQVVNSIHSNFKTFLKCYRGVSLRRLDLYIDLFIFGYMNRKENEKRNNIFNLLFKSKNSFLFKEINNVVFPIDIYVYIDNSFHQHFSTTASNK